MALVSGWGRFTSRSWRLHATKSRRYRPSAYQWATVSVELLERRQTPTTPPADIAAAFSNFVTALNTEIPTHQPQYDSGIEAALDGIWSNAGNALSDANTELDLTGSNWTDFTATVPTGILTDVSAFLGNTGTYLGGMKTDVQTMLSPVSLSGVTLPATIDWTEVGGVWNFSGVDEIISPFVGPPALLLARTRSSIMRMER